MAERFTIRSYRAGDEQQIAALYTQYTARFVGPFPMTPESWLAERRPSWRSPGLNADPEHVRVAERAGRLLGYTVTDHRQSDASQVQEFCVADGEDTDEIAAALLDDVEEIARARGRCVVLLELSDDDGVVARAGAACGFEFGKGGAVFMTAVTGLATLLDELRPELERRLAESDFRAWQGGILLESGELAAGLEIAGGRIQVAAVSQPVLTVSICPERLPLLLLGQTTVGECYLQDRLSLAAPDRHEALRLLDTLFPRLPILLPRTQWW